MSDGFQVSVVGSDVQDILEHSPLLKFSLYTQIQFQAIQEIGEETLRSMTWRPAPELGMSSSNLKRAYHLFWLWTLGAYEVIRTMSEHHDCFDSETAQKISEMKRELAVIRIPFAKQQMRKTSVPVYNELSVNGLEEETFCFFIEGRTFRAADVICNVIELLASIRPDNIKKSMPVRRPQPAST
jgi:hypothetical protein